jgi:hypothetical protein
MTYSGEPFAGLVRLCAHDERSPYLGGDMEHRGRPGSRFRALLALFALSIACVGFAGCATEPTANYATGSVTASSERVLWQVTILALEKSHFPIGARMDPATLTATSGWFISLAPFRGKGYREQCEVHYTSKAPREYDVQVRVRREKNMDIVQPLDLTYAEWEADEDDAERAGTVLQYVKSLLGNEFAVGPKKKPELSK